MQPHTVCVAPQLVRAVTGSWGAPESRCSIGKWVGMAYGVGYEVSSSGQDVIDCEEGDGLDPSPRPARDMDLGPPTLIVLQCSSQEFCIGPWLVNLGKPSKVGRVGTVALTRKRHCRQTLGEVPASCRPTVES